MFRTITTALLLGAGLALAAPMAATAASSTGVNDFTFDSFTADYYLGLDSDNRTTLKTVETLVAEFPQVDQNHGILRALVENYDGHPTDLHVVSVTDGQGNTRPFRAANDDEQSSNDDGFYQLVSRGSGYVHGKQTYVITYTQHNVTKYFADHGDDEFYWDTNGLGWDQPFGTVTARVHVSAALAKAFNSKAACYRGAEGSTASCDYRVTKEAGGGLLLTANAQTIGPRENLTVALGFRPGTIVGRDQSFLASAASIPLLVFTLLGIVLVIWTLVLRRGPLSDARGRPTIIAEYTPPKGYSLLTDAALLRRVDRASASQIVDLAVRGNIRIIETDGTGFFGGGTSYTLELVRLDGLADDETRFAQVFFGEDLRQGAQYTIVKSDTSRSRAVYKVISSVKSGLVGAGLVKRLPGAATAIPLIVAVLIGVGTVISAIAMLADARGGAVPVLLAIVVVVLMFVVLRIVTRTRLDSAGAELRDYLKGLELYIRLAEADRLRVLQSPSGADRVSVSTGDPRQMVKLNERVLPYAVLFSLEKEWAKEIGKYYDSSTQPDWYSGSGMFNAAIFAASIGSFASSTSSSFSGSSGSSSSGGAGGGGFSGGGGGGGGGGGV
jgi:uncharacterized membrane protein YgcG